MRIGVFGGTFNPPHFGHLHLAREAMEKAALDKMIFIPCAIPPHKPNLKIPDGEHRLSMVKLATMGDARFSVSDIEIEAGGKSYTAKTLERLEKIYPHDRLCFIVGADSLCEMEGWFCPGEIFRRAEIVVAMRGGMNESFLDAAISLLRQKYKARITKISMAEMEISSSEIRRRIQNGENIADMVCEEVIDYIEKTQIYEG
ncbi:MAG: nicotinate-nucleotide adenylyltransferase [Clostridia bacterium]|nr:nicotinate-nucleotide adenylyltransferase [Clostridia bacterium]